ncbi:hypothetical protein N9K16_06015 [Alphaproteobacteria bacterium]|nr:hypothetical protein [Alphaproteobacteria bacterium]
MSDNALWAVDEFTTTPSLLADLLDRLKGSEAVATKILSEKQRLTLLAATEGLNYRAASAVVGEAENRVFQDFGLCMDFSTASPFRSASDGISQLVQQANQLLTHQPLPPQFHFNDLIVQRYRQSSQGMSPHRDHIRYTQLVALIILNGTADFSICADRSAANNKIINSNPGDVILMLAPGFSGDDKRPFHQVSNIVGARHTVGLRNDSFS